MIKDIDLHDATLIAVRVDWSDGICIAEIQHGTLGKCSLTFSALTNLTLPREKGWGSSVSINSFSAPRTGWYEIEMQSGDCISIAATGMVLSRLEQN